MPSTTNGGFPYVLPADPLVQFPATSQSLAVKVGEVTAATNSAVTALQGRVGTAETNIGHLGNRATALEGRRVSVCGRAHINNEGAIDFGVAFNPPPVVVCTPSYDDAAAVPVLLHTTVVGQGSFGVRLMTVQGGPNVAWVNWVAVGTLA